MHILITWATWFIWSALTQKLKNIWHDITVISTDTSKAKSSLWEDVKLLDRNEISAAKLHDIEVVIHLAWQSVSTFPWNKKNKDSIFASRIETTKKLVACLPNSCHTFLAWSAIGYYPPHPTREYTIDYSNDAPVWFMDTMAVAREAEAKKWKTIKRRVVHLRTGLVLWPWKIEKKFRAMTKYFWWIILWTGEQWMPVITLDQRVSTCVYIIEHENIHWPVHMVAKNIQQKDYIRSLAQDMNRPMSFRMPWWLLKLLLWEMSVLMLGSWKITPSSFDD